MTCSKGTYIRTLCHDIGQKLGCGGCMKALLRTRVERFGLEDSIRLGEIAQLQKEGILEEKIIAIDEMFPTYAQVVLPPKTAAAVRNGNSFRKRDISQETALKEYENDERVRVYDESHQFIAIYCYCRKDDLFKIVKMFLMEMKKVIKEERTWTISEGWKPIRIPERQQSHSANLMEFTEDIRS